MQEINVYLYNNLRDYKSNWNITFIRAIKMMGEKNVYIILIPYIATAV